MTTKLYKFEADFGRMGELMGIFSATEEQVLRIMGKEIYFGECLGKHSDIEVTIKPGMITEITDMNDIRIGYNPVEYWEDQEEEEEED
jgi:hypothetical protein